MSKEEALKYWEFKYERAKDYYDDHWEADERRSHREWVQALEWAVKALRGAGYERGRQEAWDIAQKVFDSTVTLYEAEDVAKQIAKTELQTESTGSPIGDYRNGVGIWSRDRAWKKGE